MFVIVVNTVSKHSENIFAIFVTFMIMTPLRSSFTAPTAESAELGAVKIFFTVNPVELAFR